VLARGAPGATLAAGYRPLGAQAVRVDLVERIARAAHDARPKKGGGRGAFQPDPALATSMGLDASTVARLMAELGFRPLPEGRWAWRGRPPAKPVAPRPDNAFAALAALGRG
ncbi:helicase, partial [Sphingomonas sp. 179-I 2A4 NHS]